jgi:hypothetical protein
MALTRPAGTLSHPLRQSASKASRMGVPMTGFYWQDEKLPGGNRFSLSRRTGEGRGEGTLQPVQCTNQYVPACAATVRRGDVACRRRDNASPVHSRLPRLLS